MNAAALLAILRPYRAALLGSLILMLGESAALLVMPWLGGRIASALSGNSDLGIDTLAPALLGLLAIQTGLRVAQSWLLERTSEHIIADLRQRVYRHLQALPIGTLRERRHGDFLSLLSHEINILSDFITGTLLGLIPAILTMVGALVLMLRIDPLLAIPIMLGVPGFYLISRVIGRKIRPLARQQREAYASMVAIEEANLQILPAIKSFTREEIEATRHAREVTRQRDLGVRVALISGTLGPITSFIAAASVIVMIWLASDALATGALEPGALVAFMLYAALLTRPVARLAESWGRFQHTRGALAHAREVLSLAPESSGADIPQSIRGEIRFDAVSFAYAGRTPAVREIDLHIPAGQAVALTGANGAGKSTLIELLLRFHLPTEGRILLDGRDIATLDLRRLREAISVVPQDPMLIDGTIEENIRFGDPNADAAALERAARLAQAWEFITALPDGLATRIGDRGVRLSGGERQRLALARALLKRPSILVLDEPTAMFDPESESSFVKTAREAVAGKTVILITHRPASLALVDRVIRMEAGRMIEASATPSPRPDPTDTLPGEPGR